MAAIESETDITGRLMKGGKGWLYWVAGALLIAGSIAVMSYTPSDQDFPEAITGRLNFVEWINQAELWLRENYQWFTRGISKGIGWSLDHVENFLLLQPWPVMTLAICLPALVYGGIRLALFCLIGVMFWGCMGMWDSSMETLALMGLAVLLSVFFGVLTGIACSQNDRIESIVRPILDTMQTMPAFVYLIPAIFFFGTGGPPAILATMIYAMPPAVRLTNLGIRQVPAETIEAARSFGSTRLQMLYKVQLPLAKPSIMMGINQTVMMALGLVVLATFIGARGLGYEVWQALRQLNIGWSLEAGICIVFMAIIFDRLSTAMGQQDKGAMPSDQFRLLPNFLRSDAVAREFESDLGRFCNWVTNACRAYGEFVASIVSLVVSLISREAAQAIFQFIIRHAFLLAGITLIWLVMLIDQHLYSIGSFPREWQFTIRGPVDRLVEALTIDKTFIGITTAIKTAMYLYLLNPLDMFLTGLPWWYSIGLAGALVWFSAGRALAIVTVVSLLLIGAVGLWAIAMQTMAVIIVSLMVCLMVGVPIGILAAYNDTFEIILKPILDAMQTLPAFVYLIPVLMFFGGNVVSSVIATVIYALPPMIRLTNLGVRQVPPQAEEVARSFGSSGMQILVKIKLPLSLPSIMMGVNQAVMMALAMTVVTPLIGGKGLGKEVFDALNIANPGKGLQAGIAIVLVAILLDRLTQVWSRKQREALGL